MDINKLIVQSQKNDVQDTASRPSLNASGNHEVAGEPYTGQLLSNHITGMPGQLFEAGESYDPSFTEVDSPWPYYSSTNW